MIRLQPRRPTLPVEDARRKAALILSGLDPALLEQTRAGRRLPRSASRRPHPAARLLSLRRPSPLAGVDGDLDPRKIGGEETRRFGNNSFGEMPVK